MQNPDYRYTDPYEHATKRESLLIALALDVYDLIVEPVYDMLACRDATDCADFVSARARDTVWGNIPGEQSS